MSDNLSTVLNAIQDSWSADTAYSADDWTRDNPARGQCVISALVVQDYFGGELKKYKTTVNGTRESHYTNLLPDGTEVDVARSQYADNQKLVESAINLNGFNDIRQKLFSQANTKQRYELLKSSVSHKVNSGDATGG